MKRKRQSEKATKRTLKVLGRIAAEIAEAERWNDRQFLKHRSAMAREQVVAERVARILEEQLPRLALQLLGYKARARGIKV